MGNGPLPQASSATERLFPRPITGRVQLWLADDRPGWRVDNRSGLLVDARGHRIGRLADENHNLYMNVGYGRLASFLAANSATPAIATPRYVAVGIGANAPAAGDIFLSAETGRIAITSASVLVTYTARLSGVFTSAQQNFTLTEIGLWDSAIGPTGTATGGSTTTLVDSGAPFGSANAQVNNHLTVQKSDGTLRYNVSINASTSTTLTFSVQGSASVSGDIYTVSPLSSNLYAHAATATSKTAGQILLVLWMLTLPQN